MIQRTFGQVLDHLDAFILVMLSLCSRNMYSLDAQFQYLLSDPLPISVHLSDSVGHPHLGTLSGLSPCLSELPPFGSDFIPPSFCSHH